MKNRLLLFLLIAGALVAGCNSAPKDQSAESGVDLLTQTRSARDDAVSAGADERHPQTLAALDKSLEASQKSSKKLRDLLLRYQALEQASSAAYKKERVDGLGFAQSDAASYQAGETAMAAFAAANKEKDSAEKLLATAKTANSSYSATLFAGFSSEATKAREEAVASRSNADIVKADVAAKGAYANAGNYFQAGDDNLANKLPEAALADFQIARVSYEEICEDVLLRRDTAVRAIVRAEQRAQEVEDFAIEADAIVPLEAALKGGAE